MIQADRVHSTPPTNTSSLSDAQQGLSRRNMLAGLAAVLPATAIAIPMAATAEPDPIYAEIERHRGLSAHCIAAYDVSAARRAGA